MAERRMFTKKVTDDDNFMSLSASAQALYLHLSMSADDDGFCNQVTLAMFKAHASVQDLEALLEKRYIYQFENGVIVIKHWRMANALRKDRYTPTTFQEEMAKLQIKDNGSYTWLPDGCQVVANRLPQDRIGKDSIDKDSIGKGNKRNKVAREYFPEDSELNKAFIDYIDMRKKIKAPMTDRAIELAITKLNKLSAGDNDKAIKILEQSIMNSWKGLFELKEQKKNSKAEELDEFYNMAGEWARKGEGE